MEEENNNTDRESVLVSPGGGGSMQQHHLGKQQQQQQEPSHANISLDMGGNQSVPSFALLDGIQQDPESGKMERVTVPITRLPAILGRSHDTNDPNFFGLGAKKALSRNHFKIFYRDHEGSGVVEWDDTKSKLQYKDTTSKTDTIQKKMKLLTGQTENDLPSHGFFALECLGKNPIRVNNERLEQGECMVLESGCSLRISSYMLYFFLPLDAKPQLHNVVLPPAIKKAMTTTTATSKKRPASSAADGTTATNKKPNVTDIIPPEDALHLPIIQQSDLDSFSTDMLLQMMDKAVTAGIWERKHQIIGSAIAMRAVASAAEAPELQRPAIKNPGVPRYEIMDWIEKSEMYGAWVQQMLVRMTQSFSERKKLVCANWGFLPCFLTTYLLTLFSHFLLGGHISPIWNQEVIWLPLPNHCSRLAGQELTGRDDTSVGDFLQMSKLLLICQKKKYMIPKRKKMTMVAMVPTTTITRMEWLPRKILSQFKQKTSRQMMEKVSLTPKKMWMMMWMMMKTMRGELSVRVSMFPPVYVPMTRIEDGSDHVKSH
jgi:hypothetical protein